MFKLPVLLDLIGFHVPFARVACVSLFSKVANTSKPVVEHSSSTIQRSRWYCTNCSGPWVLAWLAFCVLMRMLANECKVIPAIKAAWVFWGARCTNSCGCFHSQMVSKNCRSHFKVCVFPAPGTPWKMVLHGSLRRKAFRLLLLVFLQDSGGSLHSPTHPSYSRFTPFQPVRNIPVGIYLLSNAKLHPFSRGKVVPVSFGISEPINMVLLCYLE